MTLPFIQHQDEMTPLQLNFLNEELTRNFIELFVETGQVVVDAGANHGFHTTTLVRKVGSTGHVHAYEPNPELSNGLRQILRDDKDILHPIAIGDRRESRELFIPEDDGWATLNPILLVDRSLKIENVNVDLLDFTICVGDEVSLMKIDIEGNELAALFGGVRIISEHHPYLIIEEPYTNETVEFLEAFGYKCFNLLGTTLERSEHIFPNYYAVPKKFIKRFQRNYVIDPLQIFEKYFKTFVGK